MKSKTKSPAKRWLAFLICLCMAFPAGGTTVSAAPAEDGLCEHHTEHTEACGYEAAVEEAPCGHEHDETCGYQEAVEEQPCTHEHDEACGYAEGKEEIPCDKECADEDGDGNIDHAEDCAYEPAEEGADCIHEHDASCGYAASQKEVPCTHEHDEACGYAEGTEGAPCMFVCEACSDTANESADTVSESADAANENADGIQIQTFSALPDEVQLQEVNVGVTLEELNLPSELSFTDGDGETVTLPEITWQSTPEFDGEAAGEYVFTTVLPEGYTLQEGTPLPEICVTVVEGAAVVLSEGNEYHVGSAEDLESAVEKIEESDATAATLVLTADISDASFAGVEDKEITVTSEENCAKEKGYTFPITKELVGDVILDHVYVKTNESFAGIFANGHKFETTEQFQGEISHLYGGGPSRSDITGNTQIILKGGKVTWLYGGGLDSNVNGDVQITIDGANADVDNLFGGGRAQDTDQGRVNGNVTIDFRKGKTRSAFGGGENRYTEITNMDTEPAAVTGTVTFNMGYEGAPAESVWPGTAMYSYGGSYHSTVGNVVLNITDGVTTENDGGDRNIFACGYSDTVRGTVRVNVFGSPDILAGFIYAGGDTEAGTRFADTSVQILNENNDEYAVRVTYDVPKELESEPTGHGINLGSNESIPTTINGNALIELKNGNMDFLVLDNEAANYLAVKGNTEIRIGNGRVAQVQGNKKEYDSDETAYTTTVELSGESEIGYFYRFDEVALTEGADVLVDATEFTQFDSSTQKPFFSVDNLFVGKDAKFTTQNNGQARILSSVLLQGIWEQRYCSGTALTCDDDRSSADLRVGGSVEVDGGTLVSHGTTHVYNDLEADGGSLVFMEPAIIGMSDTDKGRVFSVDETKIYLPVIGTNEFFYPAEDNLIRLAIGEKATGTADVYLFMGDDYLTPATITDGHIGQNYINGQREISDATFTLMADGYYFKRVEDSKTAGAATYDMWQIAKQTEQLWYYEVYYEYINPDTSKIEWTRWKHGQGGWAFPNATVTISHTSFDGKELDWEDITGKQNETLGVHYVYDENYGPHRLSALCKEATQNNPLKIYYRAALHDVEYQYEGTVPDGATALLPETGQKPYYSSVKVADVPVLSGYEFSGWTVKSPDYTKIENGAFLMPNETVTLVGSWTKTEEPAAMTVTLTAQDMIAYTGGDSLSEDPFPTARYRIEAAEDVELSKISFSVNGETETLPEGTDSGDVVILPWLNETFTLQESAVMALGAADDDAVAGEYEIGVDAAGVSASYDDGNPVELKIDTGTLTVRNVSEPDKVIQETLDIAQPVVGSESAVNTDDGVGVAVIAEDTKYYTNGREELGVLGDHESDEPQIALLFDDLIPGGEGQDTTQLLLDRAEDEGYALTKDNAQFKYLDLINENDGNAWVSTSDGSTITIYWPVPEGIDPAIYTFHALHFKGLHREYRGDMEQQVADAPVEPVAVEVAGDNLKFTLEGNQKAGSFSPFVIYWEKTSAPGPEPDIKTGNLTVSKVVTGNKGDTGKDFTFTVILDDTSVNGVYGGMTFKDGKAIFTLKHGESMTASGLPDGIHYTVTESGNEGYQVTVSGNEGVIRDGNTAKAEFRNHKEDSGSDSDKGDKPGGGSGSGSKDGSESSSGGSSAPAASSARTVDSAKTYDDTNVILPICLFLLSAGSLAVCGALVLRRQKKAKTDGKIR